MLDSQVKPGRTIGGDCREHVRNDWWPVVDQWILGFTALRSDLLDFVGVVCRHVACEVALLVRALRSCQLLAKALHGTRDSTKGPEVSGKFKLVLAHANIIAVVADGVRTISGDDHGGQPLELLTCDRIVGVGCAELVTSTRTGVVAVLWATPTMNP